MEVDAGDSQRMGAPNAYARAKAKSVVHDYWFDGACDLLCLG